MGHDERRTDPRELANPRSKPPAKPYTKPRLREYGSIAKLTQSGGSTMSESGGMRPCL